MTEDQDNLYVQRHIKRQQDLLRNLDNLDSLLNYNRFIYTEEPREDKPKKPVDCMKPYKYEKIIYLIIALVTLIMLIGFIVF